MNHQKRSGRVTPGRRERAHAPIRTGGRVRLEQVRLVVAGCLMAVILAALQSTLLGRIPLPFLSPSSPALTLVFVLAVGFFMGEREAAVMGLVAGLFADAATGEGFMLLPVFYYVMGYACGVAGHKLLAHNLPSFMIFSAVGAACEMILHLASAAVQSRSLPPPALLLHDLLPHLILTLLFAPAVYGVVKLCVRKGGRRGRRPRTPASH